MGAIRRRPPTPCVRTYEATSSLKSGGYSARDQGKWLASYQRQPVGSWKASCSIWNSDLPAAATLALGVEELALLQIERDWSEAVMKKDAAALDKIMAADFVGNDSGIIRNKKQAIRSLTSVSFKIESAALSDMKAIVFGDTAVVHGLWATKSTTGGEHTSGRYRWTDTFAKLDARWQCVTGYSAKVD